MTELDKTLAERGKTHGDWEEQSRVSQTLKTVMRGQPGWSELSDMQKETLEMEAVKISRILVGDPDNADNWFDGAGYFKITFDRLVAKQSESIKPVARTNYCPVCGSGPCLGQPASDGGLSVWAYPVGCIHLLSQKVKT